MTMGKSKTLEWKAKQGYHLYMNPIQRIFISKKFEMSANHLPFFFSTKIGPLFKRTFFYFDMRFLAGQTVLKRLLFDTATAFNASMINQLSLLILKMDIIAYI